MSPKSSQSPSAGISSGVQPVPLTTAWMYLSLTRWKRCSPSSIRQAGTPTTGRDLLLMDCMILAGNFEGQALACGFRPGKAPDAAAVSPPPGRSEEHTSELQSLMRTSYPIFCLNTQTIKPTTEC